MTQTQSPPQPPPQQEVKGEIEKMKIAKEEDSFSKTGEMHDTFLKTGDSEGVEKYLKAYQINRLLICMSSLACNIEGAVEMLNEKSKQEVEDIRTLLSDEAYHGLKTDQLRIGTLGFPDSQIISAYKYFDKVTQLFMIILDKIPAGTYAFPKADWLGQYEASQQNSDYIEGGSLDAKKRVNLLDTDTPHHSKNSTIRIMAAMKFAGAMNEKVQHCYSVMQKKHKRSEHTRYDKSLNTYLSEQSGEADEVYKNVDSDDMMFMQTADTAEEIKSSEESYVEMVVVKYTDADWVLMLNSVTPGKGVRTIEKIHMDKGQGARDSAAVHGHTDVLITSPEGSLRHINVIEKRDAFRTSTPRPQESFDRHDEYHDDFNAIDNIGPKLIGPKAKNSNFREAPDFGLNSIDWRQVIFGFGKRGAAGLLLLPEAAPGQSPENPLVTEELSDSGPESTSGADVEDQSGTVVESPNSEAVGDSPAREDAAADSLSEDAGVSEHESGIQRTVAKQIGSFRGASAGSEASFSTGFEDGHESILPAHDLEEDGGSAPPQPSSPLAANLSFGTPVQVSSATGSQHIELAYSEQHEPEENSGNLAPAQHDGSGGICSSVLPSDMSLPVLPREHSERWGSRPVVAQEQYHFIAQPIDDSTPFAAQETISFSFTPEEPFQAALRSGTVHAAGSLPPWATTEARINLSVAAHRSYVQLRTRLWTYDQEWPDTSSDNDPANMALAGFYRPGTGRRLVRCFYCGLELEIASCHNIWDEHVRYRPTCAYLQAIMGPEFVKEAQLRLARESDS